MKARFAAVLALVLGILAAVLPATASAQPAAQLTVVSEQPSTTDVRPLGKGFNVNVYNGTRRTIRVSGVGHNQNPGSKWSSLPPGKWSRSHTGINDVDQLRVPGCAVFVQLKWYKDGTWAQVHGFTPWLTVVNLNC